jgi:hypothetical protein
MLSFTIDGNEYLCPMGYGEITISEYAAWMAMQPPMAPNGAQHTPKPRGFTQRLANRLNTATAKIKKKGAMPPRATTIDDQRQFISHWLKCPPDLVDMIDQVDVNAMYVFINNQWMAWKPKENIQQFYHDGRLWVVDYSLDALAGCDTSDLQHVMGNICRSGSYTMKPRKWGGLSLDIAASIMVEVKRRHQLVAPIIVLSILQHLNLDDK